MQFTTKNSIDIIPQETHIVIPYFKGMCKTQIWEEQLQTWTKQTLEQSFKVQDTDVFYIQNQPLIVEWVELDCKKQNKMEVIRRKFGEFGRRCTTSCQMITQYIVGEEKESSNVIQVCVEAMLEGAYTFDKEYLTQVNEKNIFELRGKLTKIKQGVEICLIGSGIDEGIRRGEVYGKSINYARTLSNLPNNYLHEKEFVAYSHRLAKASGLVCEVLEGEALAKCGGILGVNAGSDHPAKMVVLKYIANESKEMIGIVGKGVLFDAGGYHLKSLEGMKGMKYDMCGASDALAIAEIVATLKPNINVCIVIPVVENLIGEGALKMEDVITTLAGKTVEVLNIDAEGRLILADAITYVQAQGATYLIDVATLTYSCQGALGDEISGVFSNNEDFWEVVACQAVNMGEKIWRLPLDDTYRNLVQQSQVADLVNYVVGYGAGASVAACFLEEFVQENVPWVHIDMVGPSVCRSEKTYQTKGATGTMITTVASIIENLSYRLQNTKG